MEHWVPILSLKGCPRFKAQATPLQIYTTLQIQTQLVLVASNKKTNLKEKKMRKQTKVLSLSKISCLVRKNPPLVLISLKKLMHLILSTVSYRIKTRHANVNLNFHKRMHLHNHADWHLVKIISRSKQKETF